MHKKPLLPQTQKHDKVWNKKLENEYDSVCRYRPVINLTPEISISESENSNEEKNTKTDCRTDLCSIARLDVCDHVYYGMS